MGTWICHLRVGERLLEYLPHLDKTAFILGSLAPDSGIPNADWTVFDPPKTVTHYLKAGEGEDRIRDLVFYRQHLDGLHPTASLANYSFRLAYFFHLICDSLFVRLVWRPTEQVQHEQIARQGKQAVVEMVKEDWYGLDHCYVREHPECAFWQVLMPAPNPPAYLDFVPAQALGQQLDYICAYYSTPDPTRVLERPFPHLNAATMARVVEDCTAACLKIYRRLQSGPVDEGLDTGLALLAPGEYAPYQPPLGDVV